MEPLKINIHDAAGRHFYHIRIVCLQVNILFTLSKQHRMCDAQEALMPEPYRMYKKATAKQASTDIQELTCAVVRRGH